MNVHINFNETGAMFLGVLGAAKTVEELLKAGFEPPICFAVVAINGASMTGSFDQNETASGLTSHIGYVHCPTGWFTNPIHVLFVDKNGKAKHIG